MRRSARGAIFGAAALAVVGLVWLPPAPCAAQQPGACPTRTFILQDAVAANANGNDAHVAGFAFLGLQVYHPTAGATPTFTLNFEQSVTGTHYYAAFCQHVAAQILSHSATQAGLWRCNVTGARLFRARISGYSGSGSITTIGSVSTCGDL